MWLLAGSVSVDQKISSTYPHMGAVSGGHIHFAPVTENHKPYQSHIIQIYRNFDLVFEKASSDFLFCKLSFSTVENRTVNEELSPV